MSAQRTVSYLPVDSTFRIEKCIDKNLTGNYNGKKREIFAACRSGEFLIY